MSDQTTTAEAPPSQPVQEIQMPGQALTRRDLAERGIDALDRNRVEQVKVAAGGVTFASALEVMEVAKLMSVSGSAVPKHCRTNPGLCLAVTMQAVEWRMSPFQVANKSYEVNDRLAFESQLVHGVIEARAPLRERLNCKFEGEGPERTCTITGKFTDGTERTYTSPKFKDIKPKNSPLWVNDPDQQLFYYSSRSWCRRWCPDVLLGIYTPEELRGNPQLGRPEADPADNVRERLTTTGEGAQEGHAESELARLGSGQHTTIKPAAKTTEAKPATAKAAAAKQPDPPRTTSLERGRRRSPKEVKAAVERAATRSANKPAETAEAPKPNGPPKTRADYVPYARAWILKTKDIEERRARWEGEREMRDELKVSIPDRNMLQNLVDEER